jgi:hypothetical protein
MKQLLSSVFLVLKLSQEMLKDVNIRNHQLSTWVAVEVSNNILIRENEFEAFCEEENVIIMPYIHTYTVLCNREKNVCKKSNVRFICHKVPIFPLEN